MEIWFDEILVGEKGRAHDVLASTLPGEVARPLAHHLDLPGQLPPGFQLQNYVSGFPHGDRYVFARTSLDNTAARQGMVFSHALIADLDVVQNLSDVTTVFNCLRAARPTASSASKTLVEPFNSAMTTRLSPELCDLLAIPSNSPAVIVGADVLEEVISALWPKLLPCMRREFRFRLSFGPEESDVSKVHVVAVPSITATRWPEARVVDLGSPRTVARTAGGRFLTGRLNGDLSEFLTNLSISCTSFGKLELACRALEMSNITADFNKTLTALRLVGSLQPDPGKGTTFKASFLHQLLESPGPETVQDFLALRNFDLVAFRDSGRFVTELTTRFNDLFESNPGTDALLPIAASAFDPAQATKDWQQACRSALYALSVRGSKSVAPLIWSALYDKPELGRALLAQASKVSSMDEAMTACLDSDHQVANPNISDDLMGVGFVLAEATVLIGRFDGDLAMALKEACERDRGRFGSHAVTHILTLMEPAEVISSALTVHDSLVMSAAAAAVASESTLLAKYSLRTPRLQALWIEALKRDSSAWQIREDADALRDDLFDCLVDGSIAPTLLRCLTASPLANALDYPHRSNIWSILPEPCRHAILCATARGWVQGLPKRFSRAAYLKPEDELALALASSEIQEDMTTALQQLSMSEVLDVFAGNPFLEESLFRAVFPTFYCPDRPPAREEMRRVGLLAASRDWREFTQSLMDEYGMANGMRDYFGICASHLGFWDQLRHGITQPSRTDLYDLFVETACALYPSGPMETEIWARAGGNPAKLDVSGTGQSQWEAAIRKVRYGGRVRTQDLIFAMRNDYPLNDRLIYLEKQCR